MNAQAFDPEMESRLQDLSGEFLKCSLNPQQAPIIDFEHHEDDTGLAFRQQLQWCMENDLRIANGWWCGI
jgi:hypothetical protein